MKFFWTAAAPLRLLQGCGFSERISTLPGCDEFKPAHFERRKGRGTRQYIKPRQSGDWRSPEFRAPCLRRRSGQDDILGLAGRPGDRWAAFARRLAGRKVRTPWSSRFTLRTKVLGIGRLRPKGDAPGNARGPTLRSIRASEARFRLRTVPQKIDRRCNAPRWPFEGKPSGGLKAVRASGLRKVIASGKGETVG